MPTVFPRTKFCVLSHEKTRLLAPLSVFVQGDAAKRAFGALRLLWPDLPFVFCDTFEGASLRLLANEPDEGDEHFCLTADEGAVSLTFGSFLGGRNAVAVFCELLTLTDGGYLIPCGVVEDTQPYRWRGLMLDVARTYVPVPLIRDRILEMAACRLTHLHLHLLDAEGYALRSAAYPRLRPREGQATYSDEEMRDLISFADALGIVVVPELDVPGHGDMLTETYPELTQCLGDHPSRWTLCLGNEGLYPMLTALIREVCAIFPSPVFHLGTDEWQMRDTGRDTYPSWDACPRCRALADAVGAKDETELFYAFVRRMHAVLAAEGKRMMMWNDNIDISRSPDLPRDILIHFWRIAAEGRGPREGCTMQRFLDEGFEVVNSYYPETYIDLYADERSFAEFQVDRAPLVTAHAERLIGTECCAWELHKHYAWSVSSRLALFADCATGLPPIGAYSVDIRETLTRLLCGIGDHRFDVFDALGGVTLPTDNTGRRGYPFRSVGRASIAKAELAELTPRNSANVRACAEYSRCLDFVRAERGD